MVPGAIDRARFLRELAGSNERVLIGVEVGTFDQLVARVAGSPPVRRTDRSMERIVVRDALARVGGELGRVARWSGFVETAREHVDRLRRARVWGGEALARAEAELPGGSLAAWRELEDEVESLLRERRLRDDAWFEQRAAAAIRSDRCDLGAVVVSGFDDLPQHRVELIERLARRIPVTVALGWRPGHLVHERAAQLRDRWRAAGAFVEELDGGPDVHPVLAWLGNELFEPVGAPPPDVDDAPDVPAPVAFVDCCGALQEAEEVVREVALLAARGFAWDEIVVASADAHQDDELLLAAFERAGIPALLQGARSATDVPAGRALHELLDAICESDAMSLVDALRAPIFGQSRTALDSLELRLRAVRERPGDRLDDPSVVQRLPQQVRALVEQRRARDAGSSLPAVRELLASLWPASIGELDLLTGIAAGIEGLATAAGGDDGIALADVRDAVAAFPLATADRTDAGVVVIASVGDLRSTAYPAVVLRGMHQAGFRARVEADEDAPAAARDLLYLAVTRARCTLRVVRQAASSSGADLAPSPAWIELDRRMPDAPRRVRRLGEVTSSPDDVRVTAEVERSVAAQLGSGVLVEDVPTDLLQRIDQHRRRARTSPVGEPLRSQLAALDRISATSLETYATCSAKWFVERHLRTHDPDDDRSRIVEGNLAHALLQHLAPDVRTSGALHDATAERAHQLAAELAPGLDRHGLLDAARVDRIVANVLATLALELDEAWHVPDAIEVERDLDSRSPDALHPGLHVEGVEVVGRVDRVDRYGSQVVLHDYKYRSSGTSPKEMLAQRRVQLLVYWLALERPGSPVEPIGALYRALTKSGFATGLATPELQDRAVISKRRRAGVLGEDERRELLDAAHELVRTAVRSLRAGIVQPLDSPDECPTYCTLQSICRIGEG